MSPSTRLRVLVGIALTGSAVIAAPQAAQAYVPGAPPCVGSACYGLDPYIANNHGTTCASDSYWVLDPNNPTGYARATSGGSPNGAQLVYSPLCESNWVIWVGTFDCGEQGAWYVEQDNGAERPADGNGSNTSSDPWRTEMVDGVGVAQAAMYDECDYTYSWHYSGWF